jgi:hypothetical protein
MNCMSNELEDETRKVYKMSITFAQKYERRLENQLKEKNDTIN